MLAGPSPVHWPAAPNRSHQAASLRLALTSGLTRQLQPATMFSVPLLHSPLPVTRPPAPDPWPKAAVRPGGGRLGCAEMARRVRQHGTVERAGANKYGRAPNGTCSPHRWPRLRSEREPRYRRAKTGAIPKVGDAACAYNQGWLTRRAREGGCSAVICHPFLGWDPPEQRASSVAAF